MHTLLSDKNPLLKEVRRAAARGELTSGRRPTDGLAVAEGFYLLEEALGSRREIPVVIAARKCAGDGGHAPAGAEADARGRGGARRHSRLWPRLRRRRG